MIKITNLVDCCGCASCVQVCPKKCISFKEDKQGFRYPFVNNSLCIDCGRCEKVCPIYKDHLVKTPIVVYAAKNKNEVIRRASSSGGIFSILAEQVITDGGVVFGAKFDENWEVVHDYTETIDGLAAFRGSKYLQSRIEDNYKKVKVFLQNGRKVLFSGTPCQIAGLKSFLQKDYDNLVCVDFVCHGVPSPKVWRKYNFEIAKKNERNLLSRFFFSNCRSLVKGINFRDKSSGWKKFSLTFSFSETSGKIEKNSLIKSVVFSQDAFMKAFLKNIILRPSCYGCRFREGKSESDITLGDFWGIDKLKPEFDDDLGVSLVMINSSKGYSFLPTTELTYIRMTYDDAKKHNSSIYKSSQEHSMRNYFFFKFSYSINLHQLIDRCIQYKPDFGYRVLKKLKLIK